MVEYVIVHINTDRKDTVIEDPRKVPGLDAFSGLFKPDG